MLSFAQTFVSFPSRHFENVLQLMTYAFLSFFRCNLFSSPVSQITTAFMKMLSISTASTKPRNLA